MWLSSAARGALGCPETWDYGRVGCGNGVWDVEMGCGLSHGDTSEYPASSLEVLRCAVESLSPLGCAVMLVRGFFCVWPSLWALLQCVLQTPEHGVGFAGEGGGVLLGKTAWRDL